MELFKKCLLLSSLVNASDHKKCVSLNNQKCEIQPTLINLHPNEYSQELRFSPFSVKLDRCFGSCDTLIDLSNKVWIQNKTEDLNLSLFNMITGRNELKTSKNIFHVSANVNLTEQNVSQINGGIRISVDLNIKKFIYVKKIMFGILLHVIVKMENI